MIINRANLASMFRGFQVIFQQAFDATKPTWERIAMEVPSMTGEEVYAWLGMSTGFREWIGDRVIQNLKTHDFTIKNKSWENTLGVDRDHIDDDKFGVYKPAIAQMGQDAREHPDQLVWSLLPLGFTQLGYDGQFFFDTDHPVFDPATQADVSVSNFAGGAGRAWYLIDARKMVKPLIYQNRRPYKFVAMDQDNDEAVFTKKLFRYGVDARSNTGFGLWQLAYSSKNALDATAYGAARAAMMSLKGDHGRPLNVMPSLLVVAPQDERTALEITQAERLANGQDNVYKGTAEILVSPWLS